MCSCKHKKHKCADKHHSLSLELEPSMEESWQTAEPGSPSSSTFCSAECLSPSTPKTSRRDFDGGLVPQAPLRQFARRPDLKSGVAVARRRLDFETIISDESFDSTDDSYDDDPSFPYGGGTPDFRPIDIANIRIPPLRQPSPDIYHIPTLRQPSPDIYRTPPCAIPRNREAPGTYELHRTTRRRPLRPEREEYPRMTMMTPCGKCVRL